jgi:hypothetical protein
MNFSTDAAAPREIDGAANVAATPVANARRWIMDMASLWSSHWRDPVHPGRLFQHSGSRRRVSAGSPLTFCHRERSEAISRVVPGVVEARRRHHHTINVITAPSTSSPHHQRHHRTINVITAPSTSSPHHQRHHRTINVITGPRPGDLPPRGTG